MHFEAQTRDFSKEAVHDLVVQRVPLRLFARAVGVALSGRNIQPGLHMKGANQRVGIEEQLQQRIQELADESEDRTMRVVQRAVFEDVSRLVEAPLVLPWRNVVCAPSQRFQDLRPDRARVENGLETTGRQPLDLLAGQLGRFTVGDTGADIAHDLFDIDLLPPTLRLRLLRTPIAAATIGQTPSATEVPAPSVLVLVHRSVLSEKRGTAVSAFLVHQIEISKEPVQHKRDGIPGWGVPRRSFVP